MCLDICADVLIDDSRHYAVECAATVSKVILFGQYAWNQGEVPENCVRLATWEEVLIELNKLCPPPERRNVVSVTTRHRKAFYVERCERYFAHGSSVYVTGAGAATTIAVDVGKAMACRKFNCRLPTQQQIT